MEVHVGRLLDVAEALQHVNVGAREDVYHACRALLVHRRDDLAVFDRAFDAFWREQGDLSTRTARRPGDDPRADGHGSGGQAYLESPGAVLQAASRRRVIGRPADMERRADAGTQGLRGVHRGRGRAGPRGDATAGVAPGRASHAPLGPRTRASGGPSPRAGAQRAHRRRRLQVAAPAPPHARTSGRAAVRRQRVDGALLAHAAAFRPRNRAPTAPRRSVRLLHHADACDHRTWRARAQRGGGRGLAVRAPVVRRHPHRRGASAVPSAVGAPCAPGRPGRSADLGRLGSWRPAAAARADQATAAELSSPDLAQSPHRHTGLCAPDAGTAGGAALRGRLPAGPHAEQRCRPGATLEHPAEAGRTTMDIAGSYTFDVPPERCGRC